MQCDLCGISGNLVKAKIEGTILNVCTKCGSFGEVLQSKIPIRAAPHILEKKRDLFMIAADYAGIIRTAREQMGLKQDELAARLHEKASIIQKLETGEMAPSILLAKKLEDFFHVKLIITYNEESVEVKKTSGSELTIGDVLLKKG